jgi:hypothetical protein
VKHLFIFHHDPLHRDDFLDQVGEQVAKAFPNGLMAKEGMTFQIGASLSGTEPAPLENPSDIKVSA